MGIKFSVNEKFFSEWTADMAYVLGFFYADGAMIDDKVSRGKYVRFINTDQNILQGIRNALGSKHSIYASKKTGIRKIKYVLSMGNKVLYNELVRFGLTPNKSLTVTPPLIPDHYINDYLRGYFDGDGCVHVEKKRKILRLIFTSGSPIFLPGLANMISLVNAIPIKMVYTNRKAYQLRYNQRDAITILTNIYKNAKPGLYLERKKKIFDEFMTTKK